MSAAEIFIGITGSSLGLSTALNKGISSLQGFGRQVTGVGGLLGGLGVGLSAAGFALFVKGGLDSVATTTRMAKTLGMSTQALGELKYMAELNHVSFETLSHGLEKFQEGLSEANDDTIKALDKLGLMPTSLNQIVDPANKAHESLQGVNHVGSGNVETTVHGIATSFNSLKPSIESVEHAIGSSIGTTDKANDKLGLLPQSLSKIASPAQKAHEALQGVNRMGSGNVETTTHGIATSFNRLKPSIESVEHSIGSSIGATDKINGKLGMLPTSLNQIVDPAKKAHESLQGVDHVGSGNVETTIHGIATSFNSLKPSIDNVEHSIGSSIQTTDKVNDKLGLLPQSLARIVSPAERAKVAMQGINNLKAGNADQTMRKVLDSFQNIKNPADKINVAMQLFGRAGKELLPLLSSSKEEMAAMRAEANKLGIAFGDDAGQKALMAEQAVTKVGLAVTGIGQTLAIQLAPAITVVADTMTDWLSSTTSGVNVANTAFDGLITASGVLTDSWAALRGGAQAVWFGITKMSEAFWSTISSIAQALAKLRIVSQDFANQTKEIAQEASKNASDAYSNINFTPNDSATNKFKEMKTAVQQVASASTQMAATVDKNLQKATESAGELLDKLRNDVKFFHETSAQAEILKLQEKGVGAETISELKKLQAQKELMEETQKTGDQMRDAAKELRKSVLTPFEAAKREIKELTEMLEHGFINKETFEKAAKNVQHEFGEKSGLQKQSGAHDAGSVEAQSVILAYNNPNKNSVQQQMLKAQVRTAVAVEKMNKGDHAHEVAKESRSTGEREYDPN